MRLLVLFLGWTACTVESPDADGLACGPGTRAVEGVCQLADSPDASSLPFCGEPEILRNGRCVPPDPSALARLPFTAGQAVRIGQGYHGPFSHVGASAYALDFSVPEGTIVRAARAGRVTSVREDSDTGCGDVSCADLANSVEIDQGDGTFAEYLHLSFDGVLVEDGEIVARGQPIALSGNTGWSTGPHLHFQVRDILGASQPVRFAELLDTTGGVPFSGEPLVSDNEELAPPAVADWSTCPSDLFAFLGVMLDPGSSCSRVDGSAVLSGRVVVEDAAAVVGLYADGVYDTLCADPGASFVIEVPWTDLGYAGPALFTVGAADPETCQPVRGSSVGARVDVR